VAFSWFTPNEITGDFSSEIRLGYLVEGDRRTPFKGGTLVGNVIEALANARWSAETGFYGDYQGPQTARFSSLAVAGGEG
jgi:predicted Zn-dependent protease